MKLFNKVSILFASLALVMGAGLVGSNDAKEVKADSPSVTYKVDTNTSVITTGTAPEGSTVEFKNTFSTADQMTKNNSQTLTLKGFSGNKITGITLSMKSNKSAGAGTFEATAGTTQLAAISSSTDFDSWFDNTKFTTSYKDVKVKLTNSDYLIQSDEDVIITITATINSLYCQSFTIFYEESTSSPLTGIAIEGDFSTKSYKQTEEWNNTGLVVKASYEDKTTKTISNDSVEWFYSKKPNNFESGTEYSINVYAKYKGFQSNTININGITILETAKTYQFNKMNDFNNWGTRYSKHTDYLTYPGLKIILASANKNSSTITDVPVTKGGDVEIIVTDNTTLSTAAFNFRQWNTSTKQTASLYTSTDGGQTYSYLVKSSNFVISETTLPENTNALKIRFSSTSNQIGLVDFALIKSKDTVENFINNWNTLRTNGGDNGICNYLTAANREDLEIMLARYEAFSDADKAIIAAANDGDTTIGNTIAYVTNVINNNQSTEKDYGINSGVIITSNYSIDSTSLIALFALLGIGAISAYYFIEKKKLSK